MLTKLVLVLEPQIVPPVWIVGFESSQSYKGVPDGLTTRFHFWLQNSGNKMYKIWSKVDSDYGVSL